MTYIPGIPLATDLLSVSQGNIKDNFTVANTIMGIDHYPFDDVTANKGRHKDVHIVKRTGNPTAVAGVQIVYSKDYTPDTAGGTADTQLFTRTGVGTVSQLSGNKFQASDSSDGWVWAGGILFQWGIVNSTSSGTVTFKNRVTGAIPFPNNCFTVITTAFYSGSASGVGAATIRKSQTDKLGFDWTFNTNASNYTGFYWMAIGN